MVPGILKFPKGRLWLYIKYPEDFALSVHIIRCLRRWLERLGQKGGCGLGSGVAGRHLARWTDLKGIFYRSLELPASAAPLTLRTHLNKKVTLIWRTFYPGLLHTMKL